MPDEPLETSLEINIKINNLDLNGFSARVFQNTATNEVVISYAGIQPSDAKDWKNNSLLFPRLSSNQANKAV